MSFEEIFGPGKQSKRAPISPTAAKWIKAFADNVAAILRVRNIPRVEAEGVAFANTVIAFLDATHPDTPSGRCAWCGKPETPGAALLPIGWGDRHAWPHGCCWAAWRVRRWTEAIAALAEMGITEPASPQDVASERPAASRRSFCPECIGSSRSLWRRSPI
jgi:hypothetical protein